jgi:TldD protein
MERRDFLRLAGLGVGAALLPMPALSRSLSESELLSTFAASDKKKLADIALNAAKSQGATYTDVRIGRYLNQAIFSRENKIQGIQNNESYGVGIRVIANGTWGFASTNLVTSDSIKKAAETAVAIAKANSRLQKEPVKLAPTPGLGEVSWKTPIERNALEVPIKEKTDFLLSVNAEAMKNGASFISSGMFLVNEQKYFASSDGSYIDQDVHRIWPTFNVTAIDKTTGKFQNRSEFSAPMGMGYEYFSARPEGKFKSPGIDVINYGQYYDMAEDAAQAARHVQEKLKAKSVDAGKYDLVLDPSHLWLTIHESVGHPLELDRVLGYEANYAGTSFATLEKWQAKNFKYGSPMVTLIADKLQKASLGAVGFDDEGVKTKEWNLVKDGILVNYQAIRDQVSVIDQNESHGCCYADSWNSVQFQRMPNVSLKSGETKLSVEEMIKNVEKGIYVVGDGSYSKSRMVKLLEWCAMLPINPTH